MRGGTRSPWATGVVGVKRGLNDKGGDRHSIHRTVSPDRTLHPRTTLAVVTPNSTTVTTVST